VLSASNCSVDLETPLVCYLEVCSKKRIVGLRDIGHRRVTTKLSRAITYHLAATSHRSQHLGSRPALHATNSSTFLF
jgi:hypothetical protein